MVPLYPRASTGLPKEMPSIASWSRPCLSRADGFRLRLGRRSVTTQGFTRPSAWRMHGIRRPSVGTPAAFPHLLLVSLQRRAKHPDAEQTPGDQSQQTSGLRVRIWFAGSRGIHNATPEEENRAKRRRENRVAGASGLGDIRSSSPGESQGCEARRGVLATSGQRCLAFSADADRFSFAGRLSSRRMDYAPARAGRLTKRRRLGWARLAMYRQ